METIQQLKEQILKQKQEIKLKEALIQQMEKDEKEATPFAETGFGKAYLGTLKALTAPFAKMNEAVQKELDDPIGAELEDMVQDANAALERAKLCQKDETRRTKKACLRLADSLVTIENFVDQHSKYEFPSDLTDVLTSLKDELNRIRPDKNEEKLQEFKEALTEVVNVDSPVQNATV